LVQQEASERRNHLPFPRGTAAAVCAKNMPLAYFLNAAGIWFHGSEISWTRTAKAVRVFVGISAISVFDAPHPKGTLSACASGAGTGAPLRAAAVSFVTKQKKPKVGLETKVSKDFLLLRPFGWNFY